MINTMKQQNQDTVMGFFTKYKKWFLSLAILYTLPIILLVLFLVGGMTYTWINSADYRAHPFQSTIVSGFEVGLRDGKREYTRDKRPDSPWEDYDYETDQLKKRAIAQKEAHLAQFLESERGARRAEMKQDNIKLPLELELQKRFTNALQFYTDFVEKKVKRENYESDKEYQKALKDEAWKIGYVEGYREGSKGSTYADKDSYYFKNYHRKL